MFDHAVTNFNFFAKRYCQTNGINQQAFILYVVAENIFKMCPSLVSWFSLVSWYQPLDMIWRTPCPHLDMATIIFLPKMYIHMEAGDLFLLSLLRVLQNTKIRETTIFGSQQQWESSRKYITEVGNVTKCTIAKFRMLKNMRHHYFCMTMVLSTVAIFPTLVYDTCQWLQKFGSESQQQLMYSLDHWYSRNLKL